MRSISSVLISLGIFLTIAGAAFSQNMPVKIEDPSFEKGNTNWNLPPNYGIVSDVAHTGTHSLHVTNSDPAVYQVASMPVNGVAGQRHKFSVWVKTVDVKGGDCGATICLEYSDSKGQYLGGIYPGGPMGTSDWTYVEGEASVPDTAASIKVSLYLRKGTTGSAWFDDLSITTIYGQPMDCALIKPVYRGSIYEDNSDQKILVYSKVAPFAVSNAKPKSLKLSCAVKSGDKILLKQTIHPVAGVNRMSMDAGKLPVGEYSVDINLDDPAGKCLYNKTFGVHKLPKGTPKPSVYIDETGRAIKDGKPFFPFGFYFGPAPTSDGSYKEHIDRVAQCGFNTIMCYSINAPEISTVKTYLDYLASRNVSILYSLKDIYKGMECYTDQMYGFTGEDEEVKGIVSTFKSHPAILGWYINDEIPLKDRDKLLARYTLVKDTDADHPVWSVTNEAGSAFGYLETTDVLGADSYPVNNGPVDIIGEWTEAVSKASDGHKAVWMVPQAMDWRCYTSSPKIRAPNLDEMLVMTYISLIYGADGLIYYSYFDLMRDPMGFDKRWADMEIMGREVSILMPALLSDNKTPQIPFQSLVGKVKHSVRTDDSGNVYVLMANTNPTKGAVVRINIPSYKRVQLLKHAAMKDISGDIDNGHLTLTLSPMQASTVIINR